MLAQGHSAVYVNGRPRYGDPYGTGFVRLPVALERGENLLLFAALVFAMIADVDGPLVGASGALFGFFGALKRWEWIWLQETGLPKQRFWRTIGGLVIINVILFFGYPGGIVAWEAHLGGFIAGWFLAPALAPGRAGPAPF